MVYLPLGGDKKFAFLFESENIFILLTELDFSLQLFEVDFDSPKPCPIEPTQEFPCTADASDVFQVPFIAKDRSSIAAIFYSLETSQNNIHFFDTKTNKEMIAIYDGKGMSPDLKYSFRCVNNTQWQIKNYETNAVKDIDIQNHELS